MPQTTPEIKIEAVRELGAEVVLAGDSYAESQARAEALAAEAGPRASCIRSTIRWSSPGRARSARRSCARARAASTAVFVPVGGGGLHRGRGRLPEGAAARRSRVIGVEPFEADAMYQSLAAGRRVRLEHVGLFADGVAVREVGERTFAIARSERGRGGARHERRGLRRHQGRLRRHAQRDGAGGRAVGGRPEVVGGRATGARRQRAGRRSCRGANMNFDRLRFVAERAELGEAREAVLGVTIPERPGAFREFCAAIGPARGDGVQLPAQRPRPGAHLRGAAHGVARGRASTCAARLRARGYPTDDLSDNEVAKLHVRHMVGGRSADVRDERLYRFEFPERPGALLAVPGDARRPLEHQPVPLPEPRGRLRPRAGRRSRCRPARSRTSWPSCAASAIRSCAECGQSRV